MRVPGFHSVVIWSRSIRRAFFLRFRVHEDFWALLDHTFPCTNACFVNVTYRILDERASFSISAVGSVKV